MGKIQFFRVRWPEGLSQYSMKISHKYLTNIPIMSLVSHSKILSSNAKEFHAIPCYWTYHIFQWYSNDVSLILPYWNIWYIYSMLAIHIYIYIYPIPSNCRWFLPILSPMGVLPPPHIFAFSLGLLAAFSPWLRGTLRNCRRGIYPVRVSDSSWGYPKKIAGWFKVRPPR